MLFEIQEQRQAKKKKVSYWEFPIRALNSLKLNKRPICYIPCYVLFDSSNIYQIGSKSSSDALSTCAAALSQLFQSR